MAHAARGTGFGDADLLLVEIADLNNDGATRAVYNRLAHSPGQPPIDTRLPAAQRPALAQLMAKGGLKSDSFSTPRHGPPR
jgi:uncharacterized protein YbaP (TraB family)